LSRTDGSLRPPGGTAPPVTTRLDGTELTLEPLAHEICRRYREEHPDEATRYGDAGQAWCVHDTLYLLAWAADDLRLGGGQLEGNVGWLAQVLEARAFPVDRLARGLQIAADVLVDNEVPRAAALARLLRRAAATARADSSPQTPPQASPVRKAYLAALLRADPGGAQLVIESALRSRMPLGRLYLDVFQEALYEVGRLWQVGEATVAQEHLATATTRTLAARLSTELASSASNGLVAVLAGTDGELHALGLRFLADFMEAEGWTVIELGASTPSRELVQLVADHRPNLVCLSTALTTNLVRAEQAIRELRRLNEPPVIAVGGHAYRADGSLARRVGADLHASDAQEFLQLLRERFATNSSG
jgi:MerR family transcriptional regulator, light-induced transcriptional regulator